MKKIILFGTCLLGINAFAANFAAIQFEEFKCGATHQPGRTNPIPDAPLLGLKCYIREGGVSGHGKSCDLISQPVFPAGKEIKTPMETVSDEAGVTTFRTGGTTAEVNWKTGTAQIKSEIGVASCKAKEVKMPKVEKQHKN